MGVTVQYILVALMMLTVLGISRQFLALHTRQQDTNKYSYTYTKRDVAVGKVAGAMNRQPVATQNPKGSQQIRSPPPHSSLRGTLSPHQPVSKTDGQYQPVILATDSSTIRELKTAQFNVDLTYDQWIAISRTVTADDILKMGRNCSTDKPCHLVSCTAIYLEEPYLEDWIRYYMLLGVEHMHFVLMQTLHWGSRRSEGYTRRYMQPYIERGQVSMTFLKVNYDVPRLLEQISAIRQCFDLFQKKSTYMMTIDPDEFYFSRDTPTLPILIQMLAIKNSYDCLPIPWYMYGSNGHITRPKDLPITAFRRRAKDCVYDSETSEHYSRRNGKVLFKSTCFKNFKDNTHKVYLLDGCVQAPYEGINKTEYHLKHYQLKSFEDFLWKRKGNGFTGLRTVQGGREWWQTFQRNFKQEFKQVDAQFNDTVDTDMDDYGPILATLMENAPPGWWTYQPDDWFKESEVGPGGRSRGKGPTTFTFPHA